MKFKNLLVILLFYLNSFAQEKKQVVLSDSAAKAVSVHSKIDTIKSDAKNIIVKIEGEKKDWKDVWLPIIVAIIIAIAAYKGVIKQSRASSISGFRVNWIEDLRVSYSKFLIALRNVDNKIRNGQINPSVYSKDSDEEDLQFLKTKIKLLLNHNPVTNPEHVDFYKKLLQYMEEHSAFYRGNMSADKANALDEKKAEIEEVLLVIFKKEWEKAKKFS